MMGRSLGKLVSTGLVLAASCWPAWVAGADKQDVRVVNTAAESVPVAVQGTATVTGGVQVTNTPTVKVAPAITDVFRKALCPFPNYFFLNDTGKLLVIEQISAFNSNTNRLDTFTQEPSGPLFYYSFGGNPVDGDPIAYFFLEAVRIYVMPGEEFHVGCGVDGQVTVSGHYEPLR